MEGLANPADAVALSHVLALMSGMLLFVLGIFRFGFLDNILSRPLLCGFINALALYIIVEQSDTFLGIPAISAHGWQKIVAVIQNISQSLSNSSASDRHSHVLQIRPTLFVFCSASLLF